MVSGARAAIKSLSSLLLLLTDGAGREYRPAPGRTEMANVYRRRYGSDTWHFCRNCTAWPTSGYEERFSEPTTGEKCNQCRAKRDNRNCR